MSAVKSPSHLQRKQSNLQQETEDGSGKDKEEVSPKLLQMICSV